MKVKKKILCFDLDGVICTTLKNNYKSSKPKIKAIKSYKGEVKPYPHSRSITGLKNLNKIRGNQSGLKYAEAFEIIRKIERS